MMTIGIEITQTLSGITVRVLKNEDGSTNIEKKAAAVLVIHLCAVMKEVEDSLKISGKEGVFRFRNSPPELN